MFKHILVPVDGSEHANHALDVAGDLAQRYGAKLTLLHVLTHAGGYAVPEELKAYAQIEHIRVTERDLIEGAGKDLLKQAATRIQQAGVKDYDLVLEAGDPAGRIVDLAKEREADLIVMGRRGLGDLTGLLLGSVTHKVAQAAECSCLTVK